MASLIVRGGKIYIQYRQGMTRDGKPRYARKATGLNENQRREAKELLHNLERALAPCDAPKPFDLMFAEFRLAMRLSASTDASYTGVWYRFSEFMHENGARTSADVTPVLAAQWQKSLSGAPSTMNTYVRIARSIWGTCIRLRIVTGRNPLEALKLMSVGRRKVKFVPWPEVQRLAAMAFAESRDLFLFVALCAYGGLRRGEALALRWEHVRWEDGVVDVPGTKSAWAADTIPLHITLRVALEPYKQLYGPVLTPKWNPRWAWERLVRAAKMDGLTPHQLRHSVATHMLNLGVPITHIQRVLRHSLVSTTQMYADQRGLTVDIPDLNQLQVGG